MNEENVVVCTHTHSVSEFPITQMNLEDTTPIKTSKSETNMHDSTYNENPKVGTH